MFFLREFWIVWRCISFKKLLNFFLLKTSFYLSRIMKTPVVWAYPMAISVEPTTACNLECPACPSGLRAFSRPTGNMKEEVFEKIFSELKSFLFHINFYFQGEPLIHPKIYNWIQTASQNKIYTLISTNAHFLSKENCEKIIQSGLHKLIISIDGMTQQVYEQYRVKGNIDKVFEGIKNLKDAKQQHQSQTPIIVLQWIAFEHNMNELPLFIEFCKKEKLHYQIKTAQVYTTEQLQRFVPKNEKYSRYILNENSLKLKNKIYNHCWRMWASCVFTMDGAVVPCCFDKDAQYEMGNIKQQSFNSIWYSNNYFIFRKKILTARKDIDICTNCSEGAQVWA